MVHYFVEGSGLSGLISIILLAVNRAGW